MARQFIYHMDGLTKAYTGGKKVIENLHLSFYPDAKIGVLGPNGSGKSTVLRIMAGLDKEFIGEAWLAEGASVGYLPQEPQLDETKDVVGNVMVGVASRQAILDRYNELMMNYSDETADEATKLQEQIDAQNLWDLDSQVEQAMDALGCPPNDADVTKLSGGEKRRVALCQLLLRQPDLLLLDEPTNHLDAETVQWLEKHLREYPGAILIVTHDRYFLDNVTGWILELDRGRGIPYEGNYSAYLEKKAKRMAQEGREDAARQRALAAEREWIAASPRGRQTKSKARIRAYDELLKRNEERAPGTAQIIVPPGERLGDNVIDIEHLSKGYGDKLLIDDLSFKLPPGGIVGVIGPNGVGKTTLFRMIMGAEKPDAGTIALGDTVHLGYVDQSRDDLVGNKTVWEEISGGNDIMKLGKREMNSRAYVGAFNFKGGDQQQKVGSLSGGQRNRVHLAKLLKEGSNVLLLDEPTNDLDTETLAALEDALEDYAGCAVVISHDRMFLDRLATHILAFEGRQPRRMVRGQLPGIRSRQDPPPRRRRRQPPPRQVQAADAVGIKTTNLEVARHGRHDEIRLADSGRPDRARLHSGGGRHRPPRHARRRRGGHPRQRPVLRVADPGGAAHHRRDDLLRARRLPVFAGHPPQSSPLAPLRRAGAGAHGAGGGPVGNLDGDDVRHRAGGQRVAAHLPPAGRLGDGAVAGPRLRCDPAGRGRTPPGLDAARLCPRPGRGHAGAHHPDSADPPFRRAGRYDEGADDGRGLAHQPRRGRVADPPAAPENAVSAGGGLRPRACRPTSLRLAIRWKPRSRIRPANLPSNTRRARCR